MANTQLTTAIDVTLACDYKRTDKTLNATGIKDTFRYTDLKDSLANGWGTDRADLFWHSRRILNNSVEILDLDGGSLVNVFGDLLNFDAIKCLVIRTRTELPLGAVLDVRFKTERYVIGPQGYRIVWEPKSRGIQAIGSSASQSEGSITFSCDVKIEYDLILIGSQAENSSSSSGGHAP
mgnify:FL=1